MKNTYPENPLIITRIFNAPRELVWKSWTDPEIMKQWWGPKIFFSPTIKIDLRVGGKYHFCMKSNEGPELWKKGMWSTGTYKEIIPMEKIVCTDSFADEEGNIVSASYYGMDMEDLPMEMLMTVTFEDTPEGKTKMTLLHQGVPEAMNKDTYTSWNESFDKLTEAIQ